MQHLQRSISLIQVLLCDFIIKLNCIYFPASSFTGGKFWLYEFLAVLKNESKLHFFVKAKHLKMKILNVKNFLRVKQMQVKS